MDEESKRIIKITNELMETEGISEVIVRMSSSIMAHSVCKDESYEDVYYAACIGVRECIYELINTGYYDQVKDLYGDIKRLLDSEEGDNKSC